MSRPDRLLARSKSPVEQLRGLERNFEQRALAGRLIVGDGRFVKMPEVVQLVAINLLQLPPRGAGPRVRLPRVNGASRIEVAVFLLRGGDLLNQAIDISFELRVRMDAQRVSGAFNHFVEVGVVERVGRELLV